MFIYIYIYSVYIYIYIYTHVSVSIKFTVKYSEVQLEVLDTLLFIINGRIESKVYFKPTDGHTYLLPQSSHHPSLYRNISSMLLCV